MKTPSPIDQTLFSLALDLVEPFQFERFGHALYAAIEGREFVPLGGVGDGGADGLLPDLFSEASGSRVLQISKSGDHRAKIRNTINRLREYGRSVKGLTYLTSIDVRNSDTEEDHLSDQLGVPVRIRDRSYIVAHINHNAATIQAALTYVLPSVSFLTKIGSAPLLDEEEDLPTRSLSVFLSQELDRRSGNTELLVSVTDSLILWSLEETDPATDEFLTQAQIIEKIGETVPAAIQFIKQNLKNRLDYLTRKDNSTGRQIQFHKKHNAYCLPFETREKVAQENTEDTLLRAKVTEQFRVRLSHVAPLLSSGSDIDLITRACHFAASSIFKDKGLEFCAFVQGARHYELCPSLDKYIYSFLEKNTDISGIKFNLLRGAALEVIRQSLYESEDIERTFFQKLARTYTLMFMMRNEPKIIDYFSKMTGKFALYVGADIIIRALSEHYLDTADQMTRNLLRILRSAGSTLILSQKTLSEVIGNIRKTQNAWEHEFRAIDGSVDINVAQQIPYILMRAFYYAKLAPISPTAKTPMRFPDFVGQFLSPINLRKDEGVEELRDYLCSAFKMEFETSEEMSAGIPENEISELAERINSVRPRDLHLATNDALQILRIYRRRDERGERVRDNPFGYRTWWLTQESALLKATEELEQQKRARFLIRPEFLMNYISFAPSLNAVKKSFDHVFPTILGVRLSNRMNESDFLKIVKSANDNLALDPARAGVVMSRLSDRLKSDRSRRYELNFDLVEPEQDY